MKSFADRSSAEVKKFSPPLVFNHQEIYMVQQKDCCIIRIANLLSINQRFAFSLSVAQSETVSTTLYAADF